MGLTVLDTGVLVAVLDPEDAHHTAAVRALRDARSHEDSLIVPVSAYAECLVWPFRAGATVAARMEAFIDELPATIRGTDRAIARRAAELRARYGRRLPLPDALVVATALSVGADRVVTTDAGWPDLDLTVEVIDARVP